MPQELTAFVVVFFSGGNTNCSEGQFQRLFPLLTGGSFCTLGCFPHIHTERCSADPRGTLPLCTSPFSRIRPVNSRWCSLSGFLTLLDGWAPPGVPTCAAARRLSSKLRHLVCFPSCREDCPVWPGIKSENHCFKYCIYFFKLFQIER